MTRLPAGLRRIAREASRHGWEWEHLGSGHIRFRHRDTPLTVTAAGTSRDMNAERILRRQMKRALEAGAAQLAMGARSWRNIV